jgi:hypothetical protein
MTRYTPPPPLPFAAHQGGRAAPLPSSRKTPAEQTPAPQPKPEPVRVVVPECTDDAPDVITVLTGHATVDDIAAAAARFRRAAQIAADNAERGQTEAQKLLEAAKAEVERIIAKAEAEARPLTEAATAEVKRAAQLSDRFRLLQRAAEVAASAEKAQSAFQAMRDERDQLAAKHAELGQRRSALGTERRGLEVQLATARDAGDLDTMTSIKARLAAIEDLTGTLAGQQAPLQQRMAEIGDGTETFTTHPVLKKLPPLAEARRRAGMSRSDVSRVLDEAFPDRPEAVAAAERQRQADREQYDIEQYYARQAEQARQAPQRRQVALGG